MPQVTPPIKNAKPFKAGMLGGVKGLLTLIKSWHLGLFNLLGLVLSLFYGVAGGSGGETTEGVFMGIYFTGVASMVLCLLYLTANAFLKRITWVGTLIILAVMAVSYIETTFYIPFP